MTSISTIKKLKVSQMAENLIGSEIIKLAGEINEKIKSGEKIYNLTIGDFNPAYFPIPEGLKSAIVEAYTNNETNYPPADGIPALRQTVASFLQSKCGLDYAASEILIAGGARPLIYSLFCALIDAGDTILFPVPSWNNNHYTHLSSAKQLLVETKAENNFMPTAAELKPHISKANLLALCSPLNPTGTTFSKEGLTEICELILAENRRRGDNEKPLYLMYDQIYWTLTFGDTVHYNPVSLCPEMREYTIFVDGLSKSFAATGIRVGWGFGPQRIIDKMKAILGHVGAWAPRAEQIASAKFMNNTNDVESYLNHIKAEIFNRLSAIHAGIQELKKQGAPIDSIAPQAALYLTVQFDLKGKRRNNGEQIKNTVDITRFLLEEAKIGIVPFSAFGASPESTWYRISVGTCTLKDTEGIIANLNNALSSLQ
ncbi:MAG TPA: aminotransferase class I/II-fold pyridoxal phosphate-dependent enzyme [Bacteroidia bacterium]|nr:aminotransferase class I/II-fold pyridoxal phosphate-dependent enzyme [Bacteroidia bacterium]HRH08812.1 aminotransferase class I/II-fold pyridoxal phosphate-dependent enzyme [Bacteroidia bacterium]HRH64101.1 aminotransferase class I/II-fold pyridoxal phosphate-dependent enzyme [Bacteroidia bacterium]